MVVGPIVHFVSPYYRFLDKWITDASVRNVPDFSQGQHVVITIAREYGSGGHLLGEMLSKELGIKLYDKEFIRMAAQRSGMDEQYIVKNEQSIPSFWLKCILFKKIVSSRWNPVFLQTMYYLCRKVRLFRSWPQRNLVSLWDAVPTLY